MRSIAVTGLAFCLCCAGPAKLESDATSRAIPSPRREFRAAWVATVANIDWPSKPGLSVERQKREALAILDKLVALNMNAVVFQVRPQADALYESALEPWSYYLTGQQGRPPEPLYDPLQFWVREAHARGLELHTWFNPYRANHPANRGELSPLSIVNAQPELVVRLGDKGYYWMDPALQAVQDHSIAVVLDVVRRYDIDGVHFDDYFYPYRSYNDNRDFPDDRSWCAYRLGGGELSRNDWRRAAVNTFIERLYREIKAIEPQVEFGISPFGIWRPGHPRDIRGLDQYDVLYADAKLWLNEGWVDYFTPQLYWPIARVPQSFPVLLGWWMQENAKGRHLWPGTILRGTREGPGTTEILNQIMITRGMTPGDPGICMFSMKSLLSDGDNRLSRELVKGPYAEQALVPRSDWLDNEAPRAPAVETRRSGPGVEVAWTPGDGEEAFLWVVYARRAGAWSHRILPSSREKHVLEDAEAELDAVAVSAVDRCGNESPRTFMTVN